MRYSAALEGVFLVGKHTKCKQAILSRGLCSGSMKRKHVTWERDLCVPKLHASLEHLFYAFTHGSSIVRGWIVVIKGYADVLVLVLHERKHSNVCVYIQYNRE